VVFHRGELSTALDNAVFSAAPGAVVGPIEDQEGLHLVKMLEEKKGTNEYIHAAHILLPLSTPDSAAVKALAGRVVAMARSGKDFADLPAVSKDGSNAQNGGDLGWFTNGRMVPAFDKAAFAASTGEIVGRSGRRSAFTS